MRHHLVAGITGIVITAALVADTAPAATASNSGPMLRPPQCAATVPRAVPTPSRPRLAATMVPGRPVALRACRYRGINGPGPSGRLVRSAVLPPVEVAAALNRARAVSTGAMFHCPADFGEQIVLLFEYADGSRLTVAIATAGCRFATNGERVAFTPPALLTTLRSAL